MINGTNYVDYIKRIDSPFYSHPEKSELSKKEFDIFNYDQRYWCSSSDDDWHYMLYKNEKTPLQGWKIHVSANINDAQDVLLDVSRFLITNKISFKFIPNIDKLEQSYSKNADRIESGKFITIYPQDDEIFCQLLEPLRKITSNYGEGPYILNDQSWKQSNVYYRYGAFLMMKSLDDNGVPKYVIKTPNGNFVEDKRVPYYYLPDFVKEPDYVKNNNSFPLESTFKELKELHISSAIHFSNSGGVYTGIYNGQRVVIKEGRPNVGIDQNGEDGFSRILSEYRILKKLKNVKSVVNPLDYKVIWKHNYLIEELIDWQTLGDYVAVNFPFSNDANIDLYIKRALKIINKIKDALEEVHAKNFAIVDLQPGNILVNVDNNKIQVKLIDFESSEKLKNKYLPNLVTQDYTSFQSKTFEDADWFVFYHLARSMFLPIETVMIYTPALEKKQNKNIYNKFGKEVIDFLESIKRFCINKTRIYHQASFYRGYLSTPDEDLSISSFENFIQGLQSGIVNNLNYKSKGLIYGDINQYRNRISKYSIGYGAMGVIMTLDRSFNKEIGSARFKLWLSMVEKDLLNISKLPDCDIGLFSGLSGIALVLYDIGYGEIAEELLNRCTINNRALDISIYSGLSGVGLANLAFYCTSHNEKYAKYSIEIADKILDRYLLGEFNKQPEYEGKRGLIKGWLGVVLFLWKLGCCFNNKKYIKLSMDVFDKVITTGIEFTSSGVSLSDKSRGIDRILPYLDTGIAGLSELMLEMNTDVPGVFDNENYSKIFNAIKNKSGSFCTYQCCLFSGTAGLIVSANMLAKKVKKDKPLKVYLSAMNNFLLSFNANEVLVPGRFGEKCCMDYETGAAGVLLSLMDINNPGVWFPLLKRNPLNIFNEKRTKPIKNQG